MGHGRAVALLLALSISTTGCGSVIVGLVAAVGGFNGSKSSSATSSAPILTAPTSIARAALVDGSGAASASEVSVPYSLVDDTRSSLNVAVRWKLRTESDSAFRTATPASSSEPVTGLASGADPGVAHAFVWAAAQDLGSAGFVEDDVVLRFEPIRGASRGTPRDISLRVGNTAPLLAIEAATSAQGRTVLTAMTVSDGSADDSTVQLAVRTAGSTTMPVVVTDLNVGAGKPTVVLGSAAGTRSTIAWDSVARFGISNLQVEVVVTAKDRYGASSTASATIDVRNDTPPTVQILSFGTASGVAEVAGRIPIRFALFDAEADSSIDPSGQNGRADVTIEVSGNGGATWVPATGLPLIANGRRVGIASLSGLAALPAPLAQSFTTDPANVHTFIWDANADGFGGGERNVALRVTPRNSLTGSFSQAQRKLGDGAPLLATTSQVFTSQKVVRIADFTNDGVPDALAFTPNISVYAGNGDGTFGASIVTSEFGSSLVTGDIDGDGNIDAVSFDTETPNLRLLFGDGTGSFSRVPFPFVIPTGVAIGDVDKDGVEDIVATFGNQIAVVLGSRTRTFAATFTTVNADGHALGVPALGDVNGDGLLDVVTGNSLTADVSVVLNAGGSFPAIETRTASILNTRPVIVVDLDGDGFADVLQPSNIASELGLFFGSATGLGPRVAAPTDGIAFDLTIADLDGDGRPEIVTTGQAAEVLVYPVLGRALGTPGRSAALVQLSRIEAGDLDGDGRIDVVASSANTLDTLRNFGAAGSGSEPRLAATGTVIVLVGDLDQDGFDDQLVVLAGSSFIVRRGLPGGSFGPAVSTGAPGFTPLNTYNCAALADLDADGRLDLVYLSAFFVTSTIVRRGAGDGTFGPEEVYPAATDAAQLAVGDMNGDGLPDIVETGSRNNLFLNELLVLLNVGGTFPSTARLAPSGNPSSLALVDVDRDGALDAVVTLSGFASASLSVFRGDGQGFFFSTPTDYMVVVSAGSPIATIDADLDGWPDVVIDAGLPALLRNRGGVLAPPILLRNTPSGQRGFPVVADLDGDGQDDLLTTGVQFAGTSALLYSNRVPSTLRPTARGNGRVLGAESFVMTPFFGSGALNAVAVADASRDGVIDVFTGDGSGTRLLVSASVAPSTTAIGLAGVRTLPVGTLDVGLVASLTTTAGTVLRPVSIATALLPETTTFSQPTTLTLAVDTSLTGDELAAGTFRVFRHEPEASTPATDGRTGKLVYGRIIEIARSDGAGLPTATIDAARGTISFPSTRLGRFQVFLETPRNTIPLLRETFDAEGLDPVTTEAVLPTGWGASPSMNAPALNWRAGVPGANRPAPTSAPSLLAIGLSQDADVAGPQVVRSRTFQISQNDGRPTILRMKEWHDLGSNGTVQVYLGIVGGTPQPLVFITGTSSGAVALQPFSFDIGPGISGGLASLPFGPPNGEAFLEFRLVTLGPSGRGFFVDDIEINRE